MQRRKPARRDAALVDTDGAGEQPLAPDSIATLQPQPACPTDGSNRRHARQIDRTVGCRRIAFESDRAAQSGGLHATASQCGGRDPRRSPPGVQRRGESRIHIDAGPHDRDAGTCHPPRAHRPDQVRGCIGDRDAQRRLQIARGAIATRQPIADRRDRSGKTIVQSAASRHLQANHAQRRFQPHARVGDIDMKRGQRKRLARWRRHQLVEFAERQPPVDDCPAQPDMPRPHADEPRAVQADLRLRLQPVCHQIRCCGVADHHIPQPLPAKAQVADVIAGGDAAFAQLAIDHARRDRLARNPDAEQRQQQHERDRQYDPAATAQPGDPGTGQPGHPRADTSEPRHANRRSGRIARLVNALGHSPHHSRTHRLRAIAPALDQP